MNEMTIQAIVEDFVTELTQTPPSRNEIPFSGFVLSGHGDDMLPQIRYSCAGGIPLEKLTPRKLSWQIPELSWLARTVMARKNCHGKSSNCHGPARNCHGARELSWQTAQLQGQILELSWR
ncbi:malate/lactate dehydrogenases [Bacillus sp. OxB-1]|nr:malate/lactate dehydrogenases [Bacillus sp. OxB-1]